MAAEMRKSCNVVRNREEDDWTAVCHGQEETTALLLLDHNEDSEPFPRGLWEKTCHFSFQNSVMLADIFLFSFMPLIV